MFNLETFNQQLLKPRDRKFDLKFLLVGNPGSGKTHLATSYTLGPIYTYMLDKGGEKTIEKQLIKRKEQNVVVRDFSGNDQTFSDFWYQCQQDEKDGVFDFLAENNGIALIDSLTSANMKAINEIAKKSGVTPSGIGKRLDMKKGMAQPHWGQLLNWMLTMVSALQELPCSVIITVHLHTLMNSAQEVVARYPAVNGQFRQIVARDFDEAYLLMGKGSTRTLYFTEKLKYEAKSRVFDNDKVTNVTMDDLANAYVTGQTMIGVK